MTGAILATVPGRRIAARTLDVLTVFFVVWAAAVLQLTRALVALTRRVAVPDVSAATVVTVTFVGVLIAYEAYFTCANAGRTPGKELLGLALEPSGSGPLRGGASVARAVVLCAPWLVRPFWLGGAVVLAIGCTAVLTGTTVVATPPAAERRGWRDLLPQPRDDDRVVGADRQAMPTADSRTAVRR